MNLEPIPALTALLMALRAVRLGDDGVATQLGDLDRQLKATKSSNTCAWPGIYRQALALLDRVLQLQNGAQEALQEFQQRKELRERKQRLSTEVQALIQKEGSDWPARIAKQEREILDKAIRGAGAIHIEARRDAGTGETSHCFHRAALEGYLGWLDAAEESWAANNGNLVQHRAAESAQACGIEVSAEEPILRLLRVTLPNRIAPRLKGYRVSTAGVLDSLGKTYKTIIATFGSISMAGFALTRIAGGSPFVRDVLPWFFGVAFLITVLGVVFTVPRERRQAAARVMGKARDHAERELHDYLRERLKVVADAQLQAIKKHLAEESMRWRAAARESAVGATVEGLPPATVDKLRGEWRVSLQEHLAAICARQDAQPLSLPPEESPRFQSPVQSWVASFERAHTT